MTRAVHQELVTMAIRTIMLVAVTVLASGCGKDEQEHICRLGEVQACPCIGGGQSVQACVQAEEDFTESGARASKPLAEMHGNPRVQAQRKDDHEAPGDKPRERAR